MKKVTETELSLLTRLWDTGASTIRELADALYPTWTDAQYATVQKLLDRLEAKGFVKRDRSQRAHTFHPLISRDDFLGQRLQELADRLCNGSLTPLVSSLVDGKRLTREDRMALRAFVADLEQEDNH